MRLLGMLGCFVVGLCFGSVGSAAGPADPTPTLILLGAKPEMRGMRVKEIRWDAVLHQNWAVLESPDHPERPLWAAVAGSRGPTGSAAPISPLASTPASGNLATGISAPSVAAPQQSGAPPAQVIHYGDAVVLWKNERNIRLQLNAVAEGNAAPGQELTLRIPGAGANGDAAWRVKGIARGPGDVEMQP